jgi:hypothetical protein
VPWAYFRFRLAQHWGIPPWEVDAAPKGECQEALLILSLEARAEANRQKGPRKYG